MDDKSSDSKFSYYEEDLGSTNYKNFNFNYEVDFDETDQYFTNQLENIQNDGYKKGYQEGYTDGYEKAKEEILDYIEKNNISIKFKQNNKSKI